MPTCRCRYIRTALVFITPSGLSEPWLQARLCLVVLNDPYVKVDIRRIWRLQSLAPRNFCACSRRQRTSGKVPSGLVVVAVCHGPENVQV